MIIMVNNKYQNSYLLTMMSSLVTRLQHATQGGHNEEIVHVVPGTLSSLPMIVIAQSIKFVRDLLYLVATRRHHDLV